MNEKQKKKMKIVAYPLLVAAFLFFSFIISARFSPAMAKVVAQIPYFSQFIKQEDYKYAIYDVVSKVADQKGYKLRTLQLDIPKKKLTITILGSKQKVNSIKNTVVENMNKELTAQNFGTFAIEVRNENEPNNMHKKIVQK